MSDDIINTDDDFAFTETGKLSHENKYLKDRVTNLEVFKKNFFANHIELVEAKEKLAFLEQQLELEKLKQRITDLPEPLDTNSEQDVETNDDILGFFKESFSADDYRDVVASIFHSVDKMDLEVTVQITTDQHTLIHSLDEAYQDSNKELINKHKTQGERIQHDDYIIFNLSNISFLAKKLPVSELLKTEQIKEFLNILSVAANSRIQTLHRDIELLTLRKNIYKIFRKTHISFESMRDNIDNQTIAISDLYLGFEKSLLDNLVKTGLSDNYMDVFKLLIHDARSELNLLLTSGLTLDEKFLESIIKLENAYSGEFSEDND